MVHFYFVKRIVLQSLFESCTERRFSRPIGPNTGNNQANYNTGGDSTIKTGDVNVAVSIMNFVNTNIIGRTLMLGIINVFGSWTGNAVPPGQEQQADGGNSSGSTGGSGGGSTSGSSSGSGGSSASIGGAIVSSLTSAISSPNKVVHNSGIFGGSGGFGGPASSSLGGTIDGSQNAVTVEGGAPSIVSDSADSGSGLFSLTFNWKILLASLIPLIAFGFLRARVQLASSRSEATIAHEIKVRKKK